MADPGSLDEARERAKRDREWDEYAPTEWEALGGLLDDVAQFIRRYVVLKPVHVDTVTLWTAHAHLIRAFYTTGRLFLRSPEPECGKSLLFDVMETLVPADPILDVSISPAALYRSLGGDMPPVVMLDEIDKTIGRTGAADSESLSLLLAVVNGGYRRGRSVRRCVGKDHEVKKFPIFAPVAFAGITPKLDRAALTRSIVIEMQRRAPDEPIAEYVAWDAVPAGEAIRDRLAGWAEEHWRALKGNDPARPAGIMNRLAECWVPLLTIAEAAGGDWPDRALAATVALSGIGREESSSTTGKRLLAALKTIFDAEHSEAIWTSDLLAALNAEEEATWATWNENAGINALDLAKRVKEYGVHRSEDIKIDGTTRKGYRRAWFEDAWRRYCPAPDGAADEGADESETEVAGPPVSTEGSETLPRYFLGPERVVEVAGSSEVAGLETPEPSLQAESSGVADKALQNGEGDPLPDPIALLEDEFDAQLDLDGETVERRPHPAKYSPEIVAELVHIAREQLPEAASILDPFAGVGGIHALRTYGFHTVGIELEPEWATQHPNNIIGNATMLPFVDDSFDAIVTSPTYANRMADHHDAKDGSRRLSYRHVLGRMPHPQSSAKLQWGEPYRSLHEEAWHEARRVLRPGGVFVLNMKDHQRKHEVQPVTDWHIATLERLGFEILERKAVNTSHMRFGQNGEDRLPEQIVTFRNA